MAYIINKFFSFNKWLKVFPRPENYTKIFIDESLSVYISNISDNFIMVIVESTKGLNSSFSFVLAILVEKKAIKGYHIVDIKIYKTDGSSKN